MPIAELSQEGDEDYIIAFTDTVGDDVEFPTTQPKISSRIVFDCGELRHISSYAIQKWSRWMMNFNPRQQFVFRKLPERLVNLFNQVKGLLPKEYIIESFSVLYFCDSCGNEETYLAERGKDFLEPHKQNELQIKTSRADQLLEMLQRYDLRNYRRLLFKIFK